MTQQFSAHLNAHRSTLVWAPDVQGSEVSQSVAPQSSVTPQSLDVQSKLVTSFKTWKPRQPQPAGWRGFYGILNREVNRFWSVRAQTIASPVVNVMMFLMIISTVVSSRVGSVDVPYTNFAAAGLMVMAAIQNAYANSSSSLMSSRMNSHLFNLLIAPVSPLQVIVAYCLGACVRALVIVGVLWVIMFFLQDMRVFSVAWSLFALVSVSLMCGALGIIAAMYSIRFEQQAMISGFVITPLSFFSGTFFSLDALPEWAQIFMYASPFYYAVDAFRYGVFGVHEVSLIGQIIALSTFTIVIIALAWLLYKRGWRLLS